MCCKKVSSWKRICYTKVQIRVTPAPEGNYMYMKKTVTQLLCAVFCFVGVFLGYCLFVFYLCLDNFSFREQLLRGFPVFLTFVGALFGWFLFGFFAFCCCCCFVGLLLFWFDFFVGIVCLLVLFVFACIILGFGFFLVCWKFFLKAHRWLDLFSIKPPNIWVRCHVAFTLQAGRFLKHCRVQSRLFTDLIYLFFCKLPAGILKTPTT